MSEASSSSATFAQMARRHNAGEMEGIEKPTSGPLPLSGYITLQSSRNRKNNKNWRALQPSDLGPVESLEAVKAARSSSPSDSFEPDSVITTESYSGELLHQPSNRSALPRTTSTTLPRIQTDMFPHKDLIPINTMRTAPQQVCRKMEGHRESKC